MKTLAPADLRRQARQLAVVAVGALLAATVVSTPRPATAAGGAGGLDATFGTNGVVTTDVGGDDVAAALTIQPDGKIVVAGSGRLPLVGPINRYDFVVARYHADGALDNGFGSDGIVATDFAGHDDQARAVVRQGDKVVVAGAAVVGSERMFALARYLPDGTLDPAFGQDGKVVTRFPAGGGSEAFAVVIQDVDGVDKIVAAGRSGDDFALARYQPDGTLDPGFGVGGLTTTDFRLVTEVETKHDRISALVVDPDGGLVAAGATGTSPQGRGDDFALARYTADGALDTGFGNGGKVATDFGGDDDEAAGLVVVPLPVGGWRIVAAGGAGANQFALSRYTADGALDTGFDGDGKVSTAFSLGADSFAWANGAALQEVAEAGGPGLRIIAAGVVGNASVQHFALARYHLDGAPDTDFGTVVTDVPDAGKEAALAVAVDPDRRPVVAGFAGEDLALARYDEGATGTTDVSVRLGAAADPAVAGAPLQYTATVSNAGPGGATVKLETEWPPGAALLSHAAPSTGTCGTVQAQARQVVCDLGPLGTGRSATVEITLVPLAAPSTLTTTVRAVGAFADANNANNAATVTTAVVAGAGTWQPAGTLAHGRVGHTATLLDGPACRAEEAPAYCGMVLVVGGGTSPSGYQGPTTSVELFDPASGRWRSCPPPATPNATCPAPLRHARADHAAVLLDGPGCEPHCGKVLVAGGRLQTAADQNAELYDPASGTWSVTGSLKTNRRGGSLSLLAPPGCAERCGGALLVGNSDVPTFEENRRTLMYDPGLPDPEHPGRQGTWVDAGLLASDKGRFHHGAAVLSGPACAGESPASWCGRVLVVGGNNDCQGGCNAGLAPDNHDSAELYDPARGAWRSCPPPATPSSDCPGSILGTPRRYLTATSLEGLACAGQAPPGWCGQVLIAGGAVNNEATGADADAELYDPETGLWDATTPLPFPRTRHTASPLGDGRVLVTGGACCSTQSNPPSLTLADVYHPTAARWQPAALLSAPRYAHTATVVDGPRCRTSAPPAWCGGVLVAGGFDWSRPEGERLVTTAELYTPAPAVTALQPSQGSVTGGAAVTISGTPLAGATRVTFGAVNVPCPSADCTVDSSDQITLVSPPRQQPGPVTVTVTTAGGTSAATPAATFTYLPDRRAITDLTAGALSSERVRLAWSAPQQQPAGPAQQYIVKQANEPIDDDAEFAAALALCGGVCGADVLVPPPTAVGDRVELTITDLEADTTYHYAVQPVYDDGQAGPRSNPAQATTFPAVATPDVSRLPDGVLRLAGSDRIATAVAVSQDEFGDGGANSVVLARADLFPDALAAVPLAVQRGGPLLLTWPDRLDARSDAELRRVLPAGHTVHIVGGSVALSPAVEQRVVELGYEVVRYGGADRYDTAVTIARDGLTAPVALLVATGHDFPDALAAGAAAAQLGAAVVLTDGERLPAVTVDYVAAHANLRRFAVGGPAARADTGAEALLGATRYETALVVADAFFPQPAVIGITTGERFPDALAGGAHLARLGGPLLLSPSDRLHDVIGGYLESRGPSVRAAVLYGGTAALAPTVETQLRAALAGEASARRRGTPR